MPQPAANRAYADELAALYREAEAALQARLGEAVTSPRAERRLRALLAEIGGIRDRLDAGSRTWLTTRLPIIHAAGATAGAETAGTVFTWTQGHAEAVQALASQSWESIAAGLRDMEASTRTALRSLARDAARGALVEGRTAVQVGRDLAAAARDAGVGTVTYANGAQHFIGDWAEALARTVTAQAYNDGTLTQSREDGFDFLEVVDGPGCGWSEHDDPDEADGTVRSVDDCEQNPISHPNCARSFFPRPDIATQDDADAANAA